MRVEYPGPVGDSQSIVNDPLYQQALNAMQQGAWADAQEALAVLEARYPESPELRRAQQTLVLRLSAEQTWSRPRPQAPAFLSARVVRILLLANLALYVLLAILWVATRGI